MNKTKHVAGSRVNEFTFAPMRRRQHERGSSLFQVLVLLVATAAGLLGIARFQYQTQIASSEHFQHKLANILVQDMASRVATNPTDAPRYVTSSALGYGKSCPTAQANRLEQDQAEWCRALQGAGTSDPAARSRAILGARGCIKQLPNNRYMITVAWHGRTPGTSSTQGIACGSDLFENENADCANDRCRRAVSAVITVENVIERALVSNIVEEAEFVPDSTVTL